jgi:hypothetical protein
MPKSPDWLTLQPGVQYQRYWKSTWSSANPTSGYYVSETSIIGANNFSSRGEKSYAVTPGYNGPKRPSPLQPLGYSARYVKQGATSNSYNFADGIVGSDNGPVKIVLEDNSVSSIGVYLVSYLPSQIDSTVKEKVDGKAKQKVLDQLKGQNVNVAQAVAERHMTISTVTSAAKTIAQTLLALKKGNFTGAAKALGINPPKRGRRRHAKDLANDSANAASNAWLALQYGWKPLLNDVYGSVKGLAESQNGGNSIFAYASGTAVRNVSESKSFSPSVPSGYRGSEVTLQTTSSKYFVKYKVRYSKSSPAVSNLASLGILNPALLAWELMPYSFVIDWFLPVGNYLGSLDATAGLSFQSGFRVSFLQEKKKASRSKGLTRINTANTEFQTEYSQNWVEDVTVSRSSLGSFPTANFPSFKNPVSSSHLASAMALLKQLKR